MNNRIAYLRNSLNLTQDSFAQSIGLSRNYVWMIEKGERIPSDRTIADICRIFNVNEIWLRTGVGEPFIRPEETEEQKILCLLSKAPPAVRLAIITLLESCVEGGENL